VSIWVSVLTDVTKIIYAFPGIRFEMTADTELVGNVFVWLADKLSLVFQFTLYSLTCPDATVDGVHKMVACVVLRGSNVSPLTFNLSTWKQSPPLN